jgi:hypothetical protein
MADTTFDFDLGSLSEFGGEVLDGPPEQTTPRELDLGSLSQFGGEVVDAPPKQPKAAAPRQIDFSSLGQFGGEIVDAPAAPPAQDYVSSRPGPAAAPLPAGLQPGKRPVSPAEMAGAGMAGGAGVLAPRAEVKLPDPGEFAKGVSSGKQSFGGSLSFLGALSGSDSLRQWGEKMATATPQQKAKWAPKVDKIQDIKTPGQAVDWLSFNLGNLIPSMGASTAGGVAGGAGGAAVGGPVGAVLGGIGGAGVISYVLNGGEVYANLIEEGASPEKAKKAAALAGLPMAILDVIVPVKVAGKLLWQPVKKEAGKQLAKSIGKEVAKDVLEEGLTEGAQEAIGAGTESVVLGRPTLTPENISRVLNAVAAGSVGGVAFGGAGAVGARVRGRVTETAIRNMSNDELLAHAQAIESKPPADYEFQRDLIQQEALRRAPQATAAPAQEASIPTAVPVTPATDPAAAADPIIVDRSGERMPVMGEAESVAYDQSEAPATAPTTNPAPAAATASPEARPGESLRDAAQRVGWLNDPGRPAPTSPEQVPPANLQSSTTPSISPPEVVEQPAPATQANAEPLPASPVSAPPADPAGAPPGPAGQPAVAPEAQPAPAAAAPAPGADGAAVPVEERKPWQMKPLEYLHSQQTGRISSDAYKRYETSEGLDFVKARHYPEVVETVNVKGTPVDIRRSRDHLQYVKEDADGEILRDEKGLALYLSDEEAKAKGYPTESADLGAFVGDRPVGFASNEFGSTGIWVTKDMQRGGLGTTMLRRFHELNPRLAGKKLGQMTPAGENLALAHHRSLVADAVKSGESVPAEVLAEYPDLKVPSAPRQEEAIQQPGPPQANVQLSATTGQLKQPVESAGVPAAPPGKGVVRPQTADAEPAAAEGASPEAAAPHKYSSTQVDLTPDMSDSVRTFGRKIGDEALVVPEGRENRPHVTLKYGLHGNEAAAVAKLLAGEGPIKAKVKALSVFPNVDTEHGKADVLKFDIDSPDLRRLHALLKKHLPNTETHPTYRPHVTVAYMKPGEGKHWAGQAVKGISGQTITLNEVVFSGADGKEITIPLGERFQVVERTTGKAVSKHATRADAQKAVSEIHGGHKTNRYKVEPVERFKPPKPVKPASKPVEKSAVAENSTPQPVEKKPTTESKDVKQDRTSVENKGTAKEPDNISTERKPVEKSQADKTSVEDTEPGPVKPETSVGEKPEEKRALNLLARLVNRSITPAQELDLLNDRQFGDFFEAVVKGDPEVETIAETNPSARALADLGRSFLAFAEANPELDPTGPDLLEKWAAHRKEAAQGPAALRSARPEVQPRAVSIPKIPTTVEAHEEFQRAEEGRRGMREMAKTSRLNQDEKAVVAAAIARDLPDYSARDAARLQREIEDSIRARKLQYPQTGSMPFQPMFVRKVEIELDKKKNPKPKIEYKPTPYSFDAEVRGKRLWKVDELTDKGEEVAKRMANQIVTEVKALRAKAEVAMAKPEGERTIDERTAIRVDSQKDWYNQMRTLLRHQFGAAGDIFADLLGATSAQTPVETNWKQALEALELFLKGDYDQALPAYEKFRRAGGKAKDYTGELALRRGGGKYNANTFAVMDALVGMFRGKPGAPKTQNYAGNFIGMTDAATIDVWAARLLQRVRNALYNDAPAIPQPAEVGVGGEVRVDEKGRRNTGQFMFGQRVFEEAARRLEMKPHELQALVWFMEKDRWTQLGLTSAVGEGGDMAAMARQENLRRLVVGAAPQDSSVPGNAVEMMKPAAEVARKEPGVKAVVNSHAVGMWSAPGGDQAGQVEFSAQFEVTLKAGGNDAAVDRIAAEVLRAAQANNQDDAFVAKTVTGDELDASYARPGLTIYFKTPLSGEEVWPLIEGVRTDAIGGFTLFGGPGVPVGKYVGMRFIYMPEYVHDTAAIVKLDADEVAEMVRAEKVSAFVEMDSILAGLQNDPRVGHSLIEHFDVLTGYKERYGELIDQLESAAGDASGPQAARASGPGSGRPWRQPIGEAVAARALSRSPAPAEGPGRPAPGGTGQASPVSRRIEPPPARSKPAEEDAPAALQGRVLEGGPGPTRAEFFARGEKEPPLAAGMTRLYRGELLASRPTDTHVGNWFSTSLEIADTFGYESWANSIYDLDENGMTRGRLRERPLGARVTYVDLPAGEVEQYFASEREDAGVDVSGKEMDPKVYGNEQAHVLPPEITATRRELFRWRTHAEVSADGPATLQGRRTKADIQATAPHQLTRKQFRNNFVIHFDISEPGRFDTTPKWKGSTPESRAESIMRDGLSHGWVGGDWMRDDRMPGEREAMMEGWAWSSGVAQEGAHAYVFPDSAVDRGNPWVKDGSKPVAHVVLDRREPVHKALVRQALQEGKAVPAEVLKDYPDLAPAALESRRPMPGFYSGLERAIEAKMPAKATAEQVGNIISNPQNGVKPEEVKWTDFGGWLARQKGPVTKESALEYLRQNQVQVEEVVKGSAAGSDPLTWEEDGNTWRAAGKHGDYFIEEVGYELFELVGPDEEGEMPRSFKSPEDAQQAAQHDHDDLVQKAGGGGGPTKYAQYTLPGGQNYRELLLTLPPTTAPIREYDIKQEGKYFRVYPKGADSWVSQHPSEEQARERIAQDKVRDDMAASSKNDYKSSHWPDESNVLAHVRFDDRTGPSGEKILHVAEIQSDWHQEGRKQGYAEPLFPDLPPAELVDKYLTLVRVGGQYFYETNAVTEAELGVDTTVATGSHFSKEAAHAEALRLVASRGMKREGVPDAPFKKTWHELAFRRVLRYASENGYAKVTWDTGATSAERYDLSTQVSRIHHAPAGDGKTALWIYDPGGGPIQETLSGRVDGAEMGADDFGMDVDVLPLIVPDQQLERLLGKDVAQRILDGKGPVADEQVLPANSYQIYATDTGKIVSNGHTLEDATKWAPIYSRQRGTPHSYRQVGNKPMVRELKGLDLKVGGRGMEGFYDEILPAYAAKYGKKWGATVGTDSVQTEKSTRERLRDAATEEQRARMAPLRPEDRLPGSTVHSMTITPAMRESVMKGQPLFAKRPTLKESPSPAGDVPTVPEIKAYWKAATAKPDTVEGQPVLWVNGSAMDIVLSRMGMTGSGTDSNHTVGLAMNPGEVLSVIEEARMAARHPRPGGFDDALVRIGRQMEQMLGIKPGEKLHGRDGAEQRINALVVVQAGEGISQDAAQRILEEELDHAKQMRLPKGLRGLPVEMLDSPAGQRASAALGAFGYKIPDPRSPFYDHNRAIMTAEIGARLMRGGRYTELNLSPEEAVELAAQYIEGLERQHGDRAAEIVEQTKDAIQNYQSTLGRGPQNLGQQPKAGAPGPSKGRAEGAAQLPARTQPAGPQPLASRGFLDRFFNPGERPAAPGGGKAAWLADLERQLGKAPAQPVPETTVFEDIPAAPDPPTFDEPGRTPMTPVENAGSEETRYSTLAFKVGQQALENQLAPGFKEIPEYEKMNVAEQVRRAQALIERNLAQAIDIAMGRSEPPSGLVPESVFVALENYATARKDVNLLRDLATKSTASLEATAMGQRIRMLGERNPNSAVAAIQKVVDTRKAAATKRHGKNAEKKVKAEIKAEIKKVNKNPKTWVDFLESIKCRP